MKSTFLLSVGLGILSGAFAFAHDEDAAEQGIVSKMHGVNAFEIEVGQLAIDRGESPKVKAYGKTLVKDHQASDKKIAAYAARHNFVLTAPPADADNQATLEKLKGATGADFDREFAAAMHAGHGKVLTFLTESKTNAAPHLKQLIDGLTPTVKKHQKVAEQLHSTDAKAR